MEIFQPGAEFGYRYRKFVWVCTNPAPRSFEKCNISEGAAVLRTFQQKVREQGLGGGVFVFSTGCLLGCKQEGTTVAITSNDPLNAEKARMLFFQKVTVDDVDALIKQYLLPRQPEPPA
jgi:predicted metal-binding protein